jgi:myo-inositol-hexaphosphate 3-phosphohydrolase
VDIIESKGRFYVAGTNRTKNNIEIYEFGIDGQLQSTLISENVQSLKDVYGITFYNGNQEKYLFVSDKKGNVEQWRIELDRSDPKIYLTRKLRFSSLVEGIVSDEKKQRCFYRTRKKGHMENRSNQSLC